MPQQTTAANLVAEKTKTVPQLLTLETAKVAAAAILGNLLHYPVKKKSYYQDDLIAVTATLMLVQINARRPEESTGAGTVPKVSRLLDVK